MGFHMYEEIVNVATRLKKDPTIRAIIVEGRALDGCDNNPPETYMDVEFTKDQNFKSTNTFDPSTFETHLQKASSIWREIPVPVIAVLDGIYSGALLQLVLGADIRI